MLTKIFEIGTDSNNSIDENFLILMEMVENKKMAQYY
jgi:hypothetical protein